MKIKTSNLTGAALNGTLVGPIFNRATDLWAWQRLSV